MARPKPAIPVNIPFHVRITEGEARAIEALIEAYVETNRKHGKLVDRTKITWFRSLVHTLAGQAGIPIVEAPPGEAVVSAKGRNDGADVEQQRRPS
jgi:hypothetical protein